MDVVVEGVEDGHAELGLELIILVLLILLFLVFLVLILAELVLKLLDICLLTVLEVHLEVLAGRFAPEDLLT